MLKTSELNLSVEAARRLGEYYGLGRLEEPCAHDECASTYFYERGRLLVIRCPERVYVVLGRSGGFGMKPFGREEFEAIVGE